MSDSDKFYQQLVDMRSKNPNLVFKLPFDDEELMKCFVDDFDKFCRERNYLLKMRVSGNSVVIDSSVFKFLSEN